MSDAYSGIERLKDTYFNMWLNWVVGVGVLVVPMVATLFMSRVALPLLLFVEIYLLLLFQRGQLADGTRACRLLPRLSLRILACSMVLMLAIILLCTDHLFPKVFHVASYNEEIPFVTAMVILPCSVVVCAIYLFPGLLDDHCRRCRRRNNIYAANAFISNCYHREARNQLKWLCSLSLALCIIAAFYYFMRYINANINAQDRFFFIYVPVAAYLFSLPLMARRYVRLFDMFESLADANPERANTTRVRFLVICDNKLLLRRCDNGLFDTPYQVIVDACPSMPEECARRLLADTAGITDADLRYCYTCHALAPGANTMLFAAFVNSQQSYSLDFDDPQWCSASELSSLAANGHLTAMMACEFQRLAVATLTWKTYDSEGHRRYAIKHYRPSFCLNDIRRCSVVYDDTLWLAVADDNEDKFSFRIRSWWHRLSTKNPPRKALKQ